MQRHSRRLQDARHLGKRQVEVADVLENGIRVQEVERRVRKRQPIRISRNDAQPLGRPHDAQVGAERLQSSLAVGHDHLSFVAASEVEYE